MPAVITGTILITGANGFIGAWAVKTFLEAGYAVRGTVRSESKATHLRNIFPSYSDKLELVTVTDMTLEGAFDEAVLGVDAVVHTASPVSLSAEDPNELIVPAVQGTLGVLRAASRSPSVKRVLFISSCATIVDSHATGVRVYDETCWNDAAIEDVEQLGKSAPQTAKYRASKTLAERRAWDHYEQIKDTATWDLVVINPPAVFGPVVHELQGTGPESLNGSNKLLFDAVVKGQFYPDLATSWVDVRDVARSLLLAITKPRAGGERIIVSAGEYRWEDFILMAGRLCDKAYTLKEPYDPSAEYVSQKNTAKAKEILGMTYLSMEETMRDVLQEWKEHGWL